MMATRGDNESRRIRERLRAASDPEGRLSFRSFMQVCLYEPQIGYYARSADRVGTGEGSDFYTSLRMRRVFAPMIAEAALRMLEEVDPESVAFVEIGAEPGHALIDEPGAFDRFAETRVIRLGEEIVLPPRAVVFANELLDAQPFHRVRFLGGRWRELGVEVPGDGELSEVVLEQRDEALAPTIDRLPEVAPEGYTLDIPLDSVRLLASIVQQDWQGVLLMFDYGKDWADLIASHPEGTARAYFRHRQETNLLARPGEQDLTCHVVWDWLEATLRDSGFRDVAVERQEAFLMTHARDAIEACLAKGGDARFALQELLHPGNLGAKFQVLHGRR